MAAVSAGVSLETRWEILELLGPLVVADGSCDLREDPSEYPPVELEHAPRCGVDPGQYGQVFEFDRSSHSLERPVAPHSMDDLGPIDIISGDVHADAGWEGSEDCGKLWREWDVEVEDEGAGIWMVNGKTDVEATIRITEEEPHRNTGR